MKMVWPSFISINEVKAGNNSSQSHASFQRIIYPVWHRKIVKLLYMTKDVGQFLYTWYFVYVKQPKSWWLNYPLTSTRKHYKHFTNNTELTEGKSFLVGKNVLNRFGWIQYFYNLTYINNLVQKVYEGVGGGCLWINWNLILYYCPCVRSTCW